MLSGTALDGEVLGVEATGALGEGTESAPGRGEPEPHPRERHWMIGLQVLICLLSPGLVLHFLGHFF